MHKRFPITHRILAFTLFCTAALLLFTACGVRADSVHLYPMSVSDENMATGAIINPDTEVRGVWIASVFNIDYPSKTDLDPEALRRELDDIIDTCKTNRLNTIFFQVRPACDALYASDIFPVSTYLNRQGELLFDPLSYLVEQAHSQNIFVHAWINPLRVTTNSTDVTTLPENSPARRHPEWTVPYADGKLYLNAGLPEVRELVCDGVEEIVSRYDVDGVVFDDYFYPYPAKGADGQIAAFDDAAAYAAYGGDASLEDWRRENINTLIRQVYRTVHDTDPSCLFGVSPFGVWQNDNGVNGGSATNSFEAYHSLYCDAVAWAKGGYVDYLSPQIYWQFSSTVSPYDVLVRWWNTQLECTGVALYVSHAAYQYEEGCWNAPGAELTEQISFARSENTYRGSIFYGYDEIFQNAQGAADAIRNAYTQDIIYTDSISNGQPVVVNTPPDGSTLSAMTEARTYLIGSSDPAFPLYLEGKKIGRTKSGYFSVMVDLHDGENVFTFSHKGEETTYTVYYKYGGGSGSGSGTVSSSGSTVLDGIKITGVYPSQRITTSADTQWISCVAPYGATVTATIGGQSYLLSMTQKPSVTQTANGYIGVIYGASVPLPTVGSEEISEHTVFLSVSHRDGSCSASTAVIRRLGANARLAVTVSERYAELKISENSSYYNDYTVQSPGMTDLVVSEKNGYYKLRMGGYISSAFVRETTNYPPAMTKIQSAEVRSTDSRTELRLRIGDTDDAPYPAYNGTMEENRFIVTFYNIDAASAPDAVVTDNPLFSACETIRLADSNKVRYALTLRDPMNFYGFDLENGDGWTTVTFRNPQKIDLSRDKPLEGVYIVLDAGHGGTDAGARGAMYHEGTQMNEKDVNLRITLEAGQLLTALGARVDLIRSDDSTVSLYERMDYLKAAEPDLSVSIHQNSMGYSTDITRIRGVLPLYCMDGGHLLAEKVGAAVAQTMGRLSRAAQYQMLALCRNPKFPQALIEVGFITNVEEYEQMACGRGITQAAQGVVNGILDYYRAQAAFAA